jgi:hypothetical protein
MAHRAGARRGRPCKEYNVSTMVINTEPSSVSDVCAHIKDMGYAPSGRVRLYGEDFEVVSDPFPQDDGIAVHAKSLRRDAKNNPVRVLQLPATMIQGIKGKLGKAA